jgi:TRAP-type mannitol/chloroaromatic compound transport system permease large subunit
MKGIAPSEIKIQEIYKGIIPFVLLQLIGLILVMWKPNVSLWLMKLAYDY